MAVRKGIKKGANERKTDGSKRARRAKSAGDAAKTARIVARVTPREQTAIKDNAKALGLSLSAYILDATIYSSAAQDRKPSILSIDPEAAASRAELIKLERSLFVAVGRLGANINQIARALNVIAYSGDIDRPTDERERLDEALASIDEVHTECDKCLATLRRAVSQAHAKGASH